MCERPADPDERALCPLCGEEATLRSLQVHVASHLEELALFVLPIEADDNDTDMGSNNAQNPIGKEGRSDDDELNSLGTFSDHEAVEGSDT